MAKYGTDKALRLTLEWVNQMRIENNREPLDSMPEAGCSGDNCPLYEALKEIGVTWVAYNWYTYTPITDASLDDNVKHHDLPDYASRFIWHHDNNNAYRLNPHR